jgi:hypothetical protein
VLWLPAAAALVLACFVVQQRQRVRAGGHPLVEPGLLTKRSYVSGVVFVLVFFGCLIGFSLAVGLFLQLGLGLSPLHASLYLTAMAVGTFGGAGVGAWATTAVGRPILHVGLGTMAVGTLVLYVVVGHAATGFWQLAPGLAVFGLGMGMIFVPLFSIIMGEIDDHEVGSASGLLESLQQLGASVGVAVLATLFFSTISGGTPGVGGLAPDRPLVAAERTLGVTLGLIALTFLVGWLLPRRARQMH